MTAATADLPSASEGTVVARLRAARRRLTAQRFLDCLGLCLLLGTTALLGTGAARLLDGTPPFDPILAAIVLVIALFAAIILTLGGLLSVEQTAAVIDQRAGTRDRFHTALDFSARLARAPLEELTLSECTRFIEQLPIARWTPLRVPRTLRFAALPLVSLALLAWHDALGFGRVPQDPALAAAVARRADALDQIAARLREKDAKTSQTDLAKLAAEMKKSAERLKNADRISDNEKLKKTLGELSSLEAMLNAMKDAAREAKVSPGELAALAAALAASDPGRDAAEALKNGRLEQAADALEKLLQQMKEQGGGSEAMQQLAQSMREQAAKLTEQEKNEVARQMEQAAQGEQSGQPQLSQKALQRLAELLRRAGRRSGGRVASGRGDPGASSMTEQQLQDLINALENMKEGLDSGEGGQTLRLPGDGSSHALATVDSFTKNGSGDGASGHPGGEHDEGTNSHLFAEHPADFAKPQGPARRVEGVVGQGDSLQELVAATAGPAKAGVGYRRLYEAMAPAAQQTVEQENIPLGSRFFVRRYFENIRPRD